MNPAIDEPLDARALKPWLFENVPGFKGLREIVKFDGGQSNPTFRIEADSGRYVLRAQPPGDLLDKAHAVDREYAVMRALRDTNVPVPRMRALCDERDSSPIGRKFFVMEMLDGEVHHDPALPDHTAEQRTAIFAAMRDALVALHGVDVAEVGLDEFGRPGDYFARQLSVWTRQYRASETDTIEAMDRLIAWLEANMPPDDGQVALVHGDWRLDNLMFAPGEPRVIGVLDWELSTLGHPMADLAYQIMAWRLPHDGPFRGLGGVDRAALGLPSDDEYVAAYCAARGIERPGWFDFATAHAAFRFAAILQGVFKRSIQGNASDPMRARQLGRAVPMLASLALEWVGEN